MVINITLIDEEMRIAFLQALKDLGYIESSVNIEISTNSNDLVVWDQNTVTFTFWVPKSQQPVSKIEKFDDDQAQNESLIKDYNSIKNELGLTCNDPNLIEESEIKELSSEVQDAYNRIVNWFSSIIFYLALYSFKILMILL